MQPEIQRAELMLDFEKLTFHFFINTLNNEEFQYYQFNPLQDSKSKVKFLRYPRCVKNSSCRVLQSAVLRISFCFCQKMLKKNILTTNQIRNII